MSLTHHRWNHIDGNSISYSGAAIILLVSFIVSQLILSIYRLFLHRLAGFPGPKLAALTYWYEYYYDVSPHKGKYLWKIIDLHKKYGPVVRVNPNEVHINDPEFYHEIYHSKAHKTDRDPWYNISMLGPGLAFTTDHDVHAMRRHALSPYFSMQSIRTLEPRIISIVEHMLERIHEAYQSGTVLNFRYVFTAFAMDIVSEYAFGKAGSTDLMGKPDFGKPWVLMADGNIALNPFSRQFPNVMKTMLKIPEQIVTKLDPMVGENIGWNRKLLNLTRDILNEKEDEKYEKDKSVIRELAMSSLPPEEKALKRLTAESQLILGAGGETTAQTLARTCFHLLNNPSTLERLHEELKTAIPDPTEIPSLNTLQKLPYLTACIEEGLRISFPVPQRSSRIFQDHPLQYDQWTIPPGAAVSQSPYIVASDPNLFPEPFSYRPERWLDNKISQKWQVTFSKGRRICLGMNLAYVELYYAIATIFRRFDLELYETTVKDVEIVHDFFIGYNDLSSKGIRVKVVGENSS